MGLHSKKRRAAIFKSLGFLVVIGGLALLFWKIPPTQIVNQVGLQNSLLIAAVLSLFGGVSSFTSAAYYTVIGAMALGGVGVAPLMVVCGPALLLGDLFFYAFGKSTHDAWGPNIRRYLGKAERWVKGTNPNWVQAVIVLYTGVSPFPGDILMVLLALSGFPFKRMLLPLLLGNMILVASIAWVALTGHGLLFG